MGGKHPCFFDFPKTPSKTCILALLGGGTPSPPLLGWGVATSCRSDAGRTLTPQRDLQTQINAIRIVCSFIFLIRIVFICVWRSRGGCKGSDEEHSTWSGGLVLLRWPLSYGPRLASSVSESLVNHNLTSLNISYFQLFHNILFITFSQITCISYALTKNIKNTRK